MNTKTTRREDAASEPRGGDAPERATFSIKEGAKILGVGRNQVYAAVHNGELPSIKVGKRFLIPRAALEKLLGHTTL